MRTMTAFAAALMLQACTPGAEGSDGRAATDMGNTASAGKPTEGPEKTAKSPEAPHATETDERTRVDELSGTWRVTGVHVAPGPVQATDGDDPALIGAVLSIGADELKWEPHDGGFLVDVCAGPQIGPDDTIGCADGEFGPPGARLTGDGPTIELEWYDGAIMTLSRR